MIRLAYHESVQLGHELSKRINDDPSSNRRGDDDSSDDDDDFQTDSGGKKQTASTRAAKEMLNVLEGSEDQPEATGKYKKLFEMDFMKKASDQKKERAREEALNILREIQEMEIDSDDEKKDESIGKKSLKDSTAFIAAKEQMKLQLVQGSAGMTLRGASKKVSVSGPISIKTDNIATKRHEPEGDDNTVRWMPKVEDAVTDVTAAAEDDQNPWLAAPTVGKKRDSNGQQVTHSNSTEGKSKGKGKGDGEKLYVKVQDIKTSAIGKTEQISSSITEGKEVVMESMKKGAAAQKRSASSSVVANAEKKIKTGLNKSAVNSSSEATSPAAAQIPAPTAVGKQGVQKERKPLLMQKSQVSVFVPTTSPSTSSTSSSSSLYILLLPVLFIWWCPTEIRTYVETCDTTK